MYAYVVLKYKDSTCFEKGNIEWNLVPVGDKKINFPGKIIYQKPDKKNIMINYHIEFINPKINTGLKDELFSKED